MGQGALGGGIGGQVIEAVGAAEEGTRLGPTDGTNRTEGDDDKTGSLLGVEEKLREDTTIVGIAVAVKILGDTVGTLLGWTMVGEIVCSMVVGCTVVGSKILGEIVVTLVRNVGM